jgi:disulfide oxidoreductase YuzD
MKNDKIKLPQFFSVDLKLDFADKIIVKNSNMNLKLQGKVVFKGSGSNIWWRGKFVIKKSSKLYYSGHEFRILEGYYKLSKFNDIRKKCSLNLKDNYVVNKENQNKKTETFHPTISFKLDTSHKVSSDDKLYAFDEVSNFYLKAYTKIGMYLVYIEIRNNGKNKKTLLYSAPSLRKEEIIGLLMSGNDSYISKKNVSIDDIYSQDDVFNTIGTDIENRFLYSLTKKIDRKFSLDEFRFISTDLPDEADEKTTLLSVGKYLNHKTLFRYQKSLDKANHYFNLDYDLNKNFRVNSRYDLHDGDVRWEVQFNKAFK